MPYGVYDVYNEQDNLDELNRLITQGGDVNG